MSAADLARLELAKRAYKAAQPSETEVQTGVRRARLSLRRGKPKSRWLGKGLVLVVLAMGGMAYAKPHALGELVENVLHPAAAGASKHGGRLGAAAITPALADAPTKARVAMPADVTEPANVATPARVTEPASVAAPADVTEPANVAAPASVTAAAERSGGSHSTRTPKSAVPVPSHVAPDSNAATTAANNDDAAVSSWGRVGQALARGDENKALAVLSELSESDDQRTRDKADLGRAQLLMAHGDSDHACSLARSLTNRRAGSRIERQAQLLLKSCTR